MEEGGIINYLTLWLNDFTSYLMTEPTHSASARYLRVLLLSVNYGWGHFIRHSEMRLEEKSHFFYRRKKTSIIALIGLISLAS